MGNGLPTNPIIGRIGLNFSRSKPNIIYAQIEVGASGGTGAGVNDDGRCSSRDRVVAAAVAAGAVARGGAARSRHPLRRSEPQRRLALGRRREDVAVPEQQQQPPDVLQQDPRRSDQPGDRLHDRRERVQVDRRRQDVPASMGGQSHGDHHTLWINPRNGNHLMIGNDGGLDVSYDQGETWEEISLMALGQFYAISADMRKPYYVCGGLQDNGIVVRPERGAQPARHHEHRLVPHRRR